MKLTIVTTLLLVLVAPSTPNLALRVTKSLVLALFNNRAIDGKCSSDLKALVTDGLEMKFWALRMLDASGKLNAGILEGNFQALGDFELCLSIKDTKERNIEGQYCTALVTLKDGALDFLLPLFKIKNVEKINGAFGGYLTFFHDNATMPLGICVPKSCTVQSLEIVSSKIIRKFDLFVSATFSQDWCFDKNKPVKTTSMDFFIYLFFFTFLFIVFYSTFYDCYLRLLDRKPDIFVSFSIYSNLKRLCCRNTDDSEDLVPLNGIKVISAAWIVLSHMTFAAALLSRNFTYVITEWKHETFNTIFISVLYAFDTLILVNGVTITYNFLKYSEKNNDCVTFFLRKFFTLVPPLLATVFAHTSLLKVLADGPYGHIITETLSEKCYNTWWKSLIFNTNSVDYTEMCAHHTWFTAINMKLFLTLPLILIFIKKFPGKIINGLLFAFLLSVTYSGVVTLAKKLGVVVYDWNDDYINYLYLSVFFYTPSWLMGVLFGYLLYFHKKKISDNANKFLWLISIYNMIYLVKGQIQFIKGDYNIYKAAFWNSLSKPIWSLSVCFIIFSCAAGQGGFVNRFLSHPVFRVLGKLTYCVYLTHVGILTNFFGNKQDTYYFDNFLLISKFCGIYVMVLICSLLLYLAFEAPFLSCQLYLEKRNQKLNKRRNSYADNKLFANWFTFAPWSVTKSLQKLNLAVMQVLVILFFLLIPKYVNSFQIKYLNDETVRAIRNLSNPQCALDLESLITDLPATKLWAVKMVDATGDITFESLKIQANEFGHYDQCLSINEKVGARNIQGQYCTAILATKTGIPKYFQPRLDLKLLQQLLYWMQNDIIEGTKNITKNAFMGLGFCVPKSCTAEDLNMLESKFTKKSYVEARFHKFLCNYKDKPTWITRFDYFVYSFFIIVFIILCGSTIYDVYSRYTGQDPNIFVTFSGYTNMKKLLELKTDSENSLWCLCGVRTISSIWIMLNHSMSFKLPSMKNPIYFFNEFPYWWPNTLYFSGYYAVCTFFALSGFLTTVKDPKFTLFQYYTFRFLRLMPGLLATIFIHASVLKLFADGPYGPIYFDFSSARCYQFWWINLLFCANHYQLHEQCGPHLWYLSVDTQLYLCAPLIFLFIKKHPKKVIGAMAFAFLTGVIYCFVVSVTKELRFIAAEWTQDYLDYLFYSILYRSPSWFIGTFFGYLLNTKKIKLSKTINIILWMVSLYTMFILIAHQTDFVDDRNVYRSALWNSIALPLWSLAVCFIIASCATGHGGFVNSFLSHPVFVFLAKISYSIFLLHYPIQALIHVNRKENVYFNDIHTMLHFIGESIVIFALSVLFYLAFEAPVMALREYLKSPKKEKIDKKL